MNGMVDIVSLQNELDGIEAEFQRLNSRREVLRQFLTAYDALQQSSAQNPHAVVGQSAASPPAIVARPDTARARILEGVIMVLRDGKPHRTVDLLTELTRRGIEIGGKDKPQTIARLLSGNPLFVPDRKVGWTLASPSK